MFTKLGLGRKCEAFRYAVSNIPCECRKCGCPAAKRRHGSYSFTYVNEGEKFIYYDVPKAASTTIRKTFFNNDNSLSLIDPTQELGQYFTFSFVRNPWDRIVSNWKMFTTQKARIVQLSAMTGDDTNLLSSLNEFPNFVSFAFEHPNHHWAPQVLYFPGKIDFIGRLENFTIDFRSVAEQIGYKFDVIPHENRTKPAAFQNYFTDDLRKSVARKYAEDIDRFDYTFN